MERKKVDVFELDNPTDKKQYEELLNDPTVVILEKNFAYMKDGRPKVTVWYIRED